jgi:hypothetical protein
VRAGWGRSWRALVNVALVGIALVSAGCGSDMVDEFPATRPEYELGGQTGSLIPGCGVAPLSAEGQSVPVGRALAVFYAKDCPELAGEGRLALTAMGLLDAQPLELVRLNGDTYLLQAGESVPAGDYQLQGVPADGALRVAEGEPVVPSSFGALSFRPAEPTATECSELLSFTLELDDAALALAPLARFDVSLDGGAEQLWIDYGALRVESDEAGSRGVLELPRCGARGCISPGPHHLRLRVSVAGQSREPEPLELDFEPCPWPAGASDEQEGCALARPARSDGGGLGLELLALALALAFGRRRRRG